MAQVSLPYTLTAGTPENVNNLVANLNALVAGVNTVDTAQIASGAVSYAKLGSDITDLIAPVGAILDYSGPSDPVANKWILADGRELSRTTFAALYTILSTTYGAGDGSTTFNIPDLRGRATVGPDNMGTAKGAASRMADNNTRGAAAGAAAQTLSVSNLPAHDHDAGTFSAASAGSHDHTASTGSAGSHSHSYVDSGRTYSTGTATSGSLTRISSLDNVSDTTSVVAAHTHTVTVNSNGAHTHTVSGTSAQTGSGTAFDNRQPYQVVNKIIRIA